MKLHAPVPFNADEMTTKSMKCPKCGNELRGVERNQRDPNNPGKCNACLGYYRKPKK